MLPSVHRMRRSTDFTFVVRAGFRARTGRLVVHHAPSLGTDPAHGAAPLIGFVVSKAVGNSVQRHAVTRRLRAQTAGRLTSLGSDSGTVVRALPAAASASSAELGRDLEQAFARLAATRAGSAGPATPPPASAR